MRKLLVSSIMFCALNSAAGTLDYECRVTSVSVVNPQGALIESEEEIDNGGVFHVERSTGTILGKLVGNSAYPKKLIIDPGGADESFKTLTTGEPSEAGGVHSIYLEIAEYSSEESKPFVAVQGGVVISGLCK